MLLILNPHIRYSIISLILCIEDLSQTLQNTDIKYPFGIFLFFCVIHKYAKYSMVLYQIQMTQTLIRLYWDCIMAISAAQFIHSCCPLRTFLATLFIIAPLTSRLSLPTSLEHFLSPSYLIIVCLFILACKSQKSRNFCLFSNLLYLQNLEQDLSIQQFSKNMST